MESYKAYSEIISKYKKIFKEICDGNKEKKEKINSKMASLKSNKSNEEEVYKQVDNIKNKVFRDIIKEKIKTRRCHSSFFEIPSDYFYYLKYFIRWLNEEKCNKKIIKYNPQYCHKVLDYIVYSALQVLNFNDEKNKEYEKEINDFFNDTSNKLREKWAELMVELKNLSQFEANKEIKKISI